MGNVYNCYAADMDDKKFSRTMGGGTKEKPISHWGKGAPRVRTKQFWKESEDHGRRCSVRILALKTKPAP